MAHQIPGLPVPLPSAWHEPPRPIPGKPVVPLADLMRLENRYESRRVSADPLPHGKRRARSVVCSTSTSGTMG